MEENVERMGMKKRGKRRKVGTRVLKGGVWEDRRKDEL